MKKQFDQSAELVVESDFEKSKSIEQRIAENVKIKFEFITPEEAERILNEQNVGNRPMKRPIVDKYVSEMLNDNWRPTHQGIAFDDNDVLQDGQHRLEAIVKSGKGQWFYIFRNLPHENFAYLDLGKNRNVADLIYVAGNKEFSKELSDIALFAMMWEKGKPFAAIGGQPSYKFDITISDINSYIEAHRDWMVQIVNITTQLVQEKNLLRFKHIAGLLFLFGKHISKEIAIDFAEHFKTTAGLNENHPILHLNNVLVKNLGNRGKKYQQKTKVAMVIKAWNTFIKGETDVPLSRIRDNSIQVFPLIRNKEGKSVVIAEQNEE